VNNVSYESPTVPILLQILSGVPVGDLLPAGSIYPLRRNESVELYIPAGVLGGPVSPILIMLPELCMTLS
jgi:iron transport multicopper oxidase